MSDTRSQGDSPSRGPFELLQHLGGGGFAETYRARVLSSKLAKQWGTEVVAIKIPKNKEKEKILIGELLTCSHLREALRDVSGAANIVRYLGFEQFDDRYVMVMEFVPGGSLRDIIGKLGRRRPVDVERTVTLARGILCGLAAIHRAGVFHRDIKPENILLSAEVPKIADLGIATMLHSNEQASSTVGTLAYMSPEILGPEGASFRSDIWSTGTTLYEMLTGRWPFGDEDTPMGSMIDLIRQREAEAPHVLRPEVPQPVSDVVMRALRKDPTERFRSAEEMAEAFQSGDKLQERLREVRKLLITADTQRQAEELLRQILRDFPEDPRAYQNLGEFCNRLERYREAIKMFEEGLKHDAHCAVLHWDLTLAHQKLGDKPKAASHLKQAMALGLDPQLARPAAVLLKTLEGEWL